MSEAERKIIEILEAQNKMLDALVENNIRQCGFMKNALDALVIIGTQLSAENEVESVADMIATMRDTIGEINDSVQEVSTHTEAVADALDSAQVNNFCSMICDIGGDVEKLREAYVQDEEEEDVVVVHQQVSDDSPVGGGE